ncbi:UNVERIFIED_CONTAM: hypothetical protein Sradi_3122700 [Sesamum radiatum]|uniref:Uncharacterized protein n=1 Tax=Sesamum radiatum TaxID=300843 RepID=A0AAW2RDA8_SESRA
MRSGAEKVEDMGQRDFHSAVNSIGGSGGCQISDAATLESWRSRIQLPAGLRTLP